MPKFTFETQRSDEETEPDFVTGEFDTVEHARREANQAFHEMAMDVRPSAELSTVRVTVKDDQGRIVARRVARFEAEDINP
ncbi:hypothetical protein SAMN06295905_1323 [Devosia lucknowensis]|uniref:DUF6894 domain-containing protein n=1 Tax=Devosia lucknowensis TaxID=1096929 RepID=A0A1Y6ESW8_9HYPH|nr:hypothetical protein [Devosia lucknowensis]SMQ65814.1 hypothetical protein SAMN06295905_1323 [Devosia lucknowensis]